MGLSLNAFSPKWVQKQVDPVGYCFDKLDTVPEQRSSSGSPARIDWRRIKKHLIEEGKGGEQLCSCEAPGESHKFHFIRVLMVNSNQWLLITYVLSRRRRRSWGWSPIGWRSRPRTPSPTWGARGLFPRKVDGKQKCSWIPEEGVLDKKLQFLSPLCVDSWKWIYVFKVRGMFFSSDLWERITFYSEDFVL